MRRFGANETVDDREASRYYDRFASTDPKDQEFDNDTMHRSATEYLGKLPDEQFNQAAQQAYTKAEPAQRQGLLGGLLGALGGGGADIGTLARKIGLGSTDPNQMSGDDAAKLMNYARRERPEAIRQTVAEKPWFVKALGNPVVLGALTMAAAKMVQRQRGG